MQQKDKFADKVVDAFVEGSRKTYDVLYVYGHPSATAELAARVAQDYRRLHPEAKIALESGNAFSEKFIERIKAGENIFPWRKETWNLLIFENIQELGGKEHSQELAYELLDLLLRQGGQILVTGDKSIPNLLQLEERICAQLSGGLSVKIKN